MAGPGADVNALAKTSHVFRVTIEGDNTGPRLTAMFKSVKGLNRSFQSSPVAEGGRTTGQLALPDKMPHYGPVTLESGLVNETFFWDWSRQVNRGAQFRRNVIIDHLEPGTEKVIQTYRLDRAWPMSWSLSDLDSQNSSALAMITVQLAFDDLRLGQEPQRKAPEKAVLSTTEGDKLTVNLPINPTTMKISRSVQWRGVETAHMAYPSLAVSTGQLDNLSLEGIIVDGTDGSANVPQVLETLQKMTLAIKLSDWAQARPPLIRFAWKNTRFEGGLSSLNAEVTLRDEEGAPIRATVSIQLTGKQNGVGESSPLVQRTRNEAAQAQTPPAKMPGFEED